MVLHRCAMPGCQEDATGIFCPGHYVQLPPKEAKWLVRLQIMILRSDDADRKQHLREQLHGYTQAAIRLLQKSEAPTSSQVTLDSARRQPSSLAAGASAPGAL
jgi:hypothetical protein